MNIKKLILISLFLFFVAFENIKAQSILPDSLKNAIGRKANSLQVTLHPISAVLDTLHSINPRKKSKAKIEETESKINDKLHSSKAVNTADSLSQSIDKSIDKLDLAKKLDEEVEEIPELEEYSERLDEIKKVPEDYAQDIKGMEEFQEAKGHLDKPEKFNAHYDEYNKEAENISKGNFRETEKLQQELEKKAGNLNEVQALESEAASIEELGKMPEQYQQKMDQYRDAQYLQGQLKSKIKSIADKSFNYREKVEAAMGEIKKFKKKYSSLHSSDSLPEKWSSLKGEPLKKRLIFGGNFQIHPGDPMAVDISPLIGYRFTKKLSAGIGGTYRQSFGGESTLSYAVAPQAYGGRTFSEYAVAKSFFVHAAFESLQTASSDSVSDARSNQWVHGALAGIGREFKITKKVKGKIMLLYNFLHQKDGLARGAGRPYRKRLMVRFGIGL